MLSNPYAMSATGGVIPHHGLPDLNDRFRLGFDRSFGFSRTLIHTNSASPRNTEPAINHGAYTGAVISGADLKPRFTCSERSHVQGSSFSSETLSTAGGRGSAARKA